MINIVFAICTFNRIHLLKPLIVSILNQLKKFDNSNIVAIIDNNCNDGTAEFIKSLTKDNQNLHYYFEPVQGIARARNRVIEEIDAYYYYYLDDDAILNNEFVSCAIETINKIRPQALTGPIVNKYEVEVPDWYPKFEFKYSDLSGYSDQITPYGMNMCISKELLSSGLKFDENLGYKGNYFLLGEETKLFKSARIIHGSIDVYYDTRLQIMHHVPPGRSTIEYKLHRSLAGGYTDQILESPFGRYRKLILAIGLIIIKFASYGFRWSFGLANDKWKYFELSRAYVAIGFIMSFLRIPLKLINKR